MKGTHIFWLICTRPYRLLDYQIIVTDTRVFFPDVSLRMRAACAATWAAILSNLCQVDSQIILADWAARWPRRFTTLGTPVTTTYNIHGHNLDSMDSGKYLGLNFHHQLSWTPHMYQTAKKANRTRAFLQRKIRSAPYHIKNSATSHSSGLLWTMAASFGTSHPLRPPISWRCCSVDTLGLSRKTITGPAASQRWFVTSAGILCKLAAAAEEPPWSIESRMTL